MKDFFTKYKIDDEVIAAAVSGGADSLALALNLQQIGKKVVALTVDHGLRTESADEAQYVAEVMSENGIEHHVLCWKGDKPKSGIEEAARRARYKLMIDYCRQNGIKVLAVGHHRRDQAETFLLRLQRGSGVLGLSGILPVSERDGITVIRPQLDKTPEYLKDILRKRHIKWVEDPMNECDDFMRVKIRHFLPELARLGIDERRLADTAATLLKTRLFLQKVANEFIANKVRSWGNDAAISLSWQNLYSQDLQIGQIILSELVRRVGESDYPPEAAEVERILTVGENFSGGCVGGCELLLAAKRLWIVRQNRENELLSKAEWQDFTKRYPEYRYVGLPYKVRRAIKNKLERENG